MDSNVGRREKSVERYADAIIWYMENPEALEAKPDGLLKEYIKYMIRKVEEASEPQNFRNKENP